MRQRLTTVLTDLPTNRQSIMKQANKVLLVQRPFKTPSVQTYQSDNIYSIIEQGDQRRLVITLVFVSDQQNIQETNLSDVFTTA